jgi:catechol 2,3-dioxygenase-like lactoylglutathione lyase family enzyme
MAARWPTFLESLGRAIAVSWKTSMKIRFGISAAFCFVVLLAGGAPALADEQPPATPTGMTLRLELFVSDMAKSLEFYTQVLGFERLKGQPNYAPVRSGSVLIALGPAKGLPPKHHFNPEVQSNRRGLGVEIVLEVDDVQAYFEKAKASGYQGTLTPLQKRPWGATDFRVVDPDGYYLRVTSR